MSLFEITLDGQQHSGSYETRKIAEQELEKMKASQPDTFRGKVAAVQERDMSDNEGASRYVTRDGNGVPQTQVPLDAQAPSTTSDGNSGPIIQGPPANTLPGPGGAVQTEGSAPAGAKPSVAPKK